MSQPVVISVANALEKQQTFQGTTTNGTPGGPSCAPATVNNVNVWYQFTTDAAVELIYADTLDTASGIDTQVYFVSAGAVTGVSLQR